MALRLTVIFALLSFVFADPSWKLVSTVNKYPGRQETSFSQCGDNKLCLIGGRGENLVSILDTKALSWSAGKNGPSEMHHFQAVYGPDGCVWVAGAWRGPFPEEDTVDEIWAYCRAEDKWEKRVSIPRPRGAGGAVFYKGKLYIVSGNVGGHNADAEVVPWFDCYDPATGEWTQLADVPNPRDHFHVVVLGSKLYVAGGRFSTSTIPEFFSDVATKVDVYDFETKSWSALADLPRPRGGVAATTYDSTVLLLGGESERNLAWTEVDILRNGKFVPFEDMPDPRHGTGAVFCNGAVWIAGGVRFQGGGDKSDETYAYFDGNIPPECTDSSNNNSPSPSSSSGPPNSSAGGASDSPSPSDSSSPSDSPSPSGSPASSSDDTTSNATGDEDDSSADTSQTPSDPSQSASGSESACFPSDATVELEDGSVKRMDQLRIGDCVKVAHPDQYSEVYFFSHNHPVKESKSIRIETSVDDVSLTLSPGHILYLNGSPMQASVVRKGDLVSISHDSHTQATVTRVTAVTTRGLHNPHTLHGDIVVNRVVATTYTASVHTSVARVLLLPLKAIYNACGATAGVENLNKIILRALDITFWRR